jgi:integrase/recombinase XerD
MPLNPKNERIKRKYLIYLKEAKRLSDRTLDSIARALEQFEVYTKRREFQRFHIEQALGFKKMLTEQVSPRTKTRLSVATVHSKLMPLKSFFQWLAGQPGYKSRIHYPDAEYFNPSARDARIAKARHERPVPTIQQIRHVIFSMPLATSIDRRNQALIAFVLLTGARDGAIASLRLKHVDMIEGKVLQDAREVQTKFSKSFDTFFFPVGEDIRGIVEAWVRLLRDEMLWGNDDPLFPATKIAPGPDRQFATQGLARTGWRSTDSIRVIFRMAFRQAGLPYFNPHSFRSVVTQLGQQVCQTPEDFKAWSQNLGHEGVLTTFTSYGTVSSRRQAEIIRSLGRGLP